MVKPAKQRFNLWYRLNSECEWQPAYTEGSDVENAKAALLLAVKTLYRIGSKDIEIVETIGSEAVYPPKEVYSYTNGYPETGDYCGF